ncbi:MAG: metalloregulator ArsR/SmtB family transcription factor [Planctomycetota bacterium]|jgi:arsenate reductase
MDSAVAALGALAHESRLGIFRLLVRDELTAGELAAQLELPASSLSFHLRALSNAGLIASTREGTSLHYRVCSDQLKELLWFLGEDCCQGRTELSLTQRIDERKREATDSVLFVCSRNSARSQMAEALLRRQDPSIEVYSGGLRPAAIHPMTLRVLKEAGVPTTELFAKDLGSLLGKVSFGTAIVVCEAANADCPPIASFAPEQLYWPFEDPVEAGTLKAFRAVRDAIAKRIRRWKR